MQGQLKAIKNSEQQDLMKLEREMQEIEEWKELEAIEEDIIKDYKMSEGQYNVLISIYEASELVAKPDSFFIFNANKQHCNAFVEVECNKAVRKTKVRKETNNPIFDEHFYMNFKDMTKEDLENATLKFTVYDRSALIIKRSVLGVVELDWTNVYFRRNHEIFRGWLTLTDPTDQIQGPIGYLLVNVAILGSHDKITVHDSGFIKNPLTTIEDTITIKKLKLLDFAINIEVYRAEHLVPLDPSVATLSAYAVAKFSGSKIRTSIVRSVNPEWNEALKLGAKIPTKSKFITLEIWDHNLIIDQLVGVVRIPFTSICNKNVIGPKWFNIYGPPLSGVDKEPLNYATKMQIYGDQLGSHYRGRVLLKISGFEEVYTKTVREKLKFEFPFNPVPSIPQKNLTLRAYIFEGVELPSVNKECSVHILMGPYLLKSKKQVPSKGMCSFYEKLEDKKVMFPYVETQLDQLPDIIIYYCKGDFEKDRMSFVRVKASTIFCKDNRDTDIVTLELKEDRSLDAIDNSEAGGFLTVKLQLFEGKPTPPIDLQAYKKIPVESYQLRMYLYMGRELPPINQTGDSDPMVKFRCFGQQALSEHKKSQINPIWNLVVTMNVQFQDIFKTVSSKGVMCTLLDHEDNGKHKFVGRFWLPIVVGDKRSYRTRNGGSVTIMHHKPRWFYVKNENISIKKISLGKILLGYSLIRTADLQTIPRAPSILSPGFEMKKLQVFVIGLRGIDADDSWKTAQAAITFSGCTQALTTTEQKIKDGGCTFNSLFMADLVFPHNKNLVPFMDVRLYNIKRKKPEFMGFASANVLNLIPKILKDSDRKKNLEIQGKNKLQPIQEENSRSEDTILNVEKLEREIQIIKRRRKMMQELDEKDNTHHLKERKVAELLVPNQLAEGQRDVRENNLKDQFKQEFDKLLEEYDTDIEHFDANIEPNDIEKKNDQLQSQKQQSVVQVAIEPEQGEEQPLINQAQQGFQRLEGRGNLARSEFGGSGKSISIGKKYADENEKLLQQKLEIQSQARIDKDKKEAENIFRYGKGLNQELQPVQGQNKTRSIQSLNLHTNDEISVANSAQARDINYKNIQEALRQEHKHEQLARKREQEYKYAAAVKLTLFQWTRGKKKNTDEQTYEDYDTEPDENLDITPEWYKGRKIMSTDFEQLIKPTRKLVKVDVFSGGKNSKDQGAEDLRVIKKIATLKFIAMFYDDEKELKMKERYYNKILTPKTYMCRLYFLKGKSLISEHRGNPTTYLKITYGEKVFDLEKKTLVKDQRNPEYFICQQIVMELPGPATVKVEVMEKYSYFQDRVLGYTEIDIENRFLTKKWHLFTKKPIQLRNLYSQYGSGSQGRLETYIDLIERKDWETNPPDPIAPPPYDEYELRVIVWTTKDCIYKDEAEECNDIFVRGSIGTSDAQDTDTHWRCRGIGSFNWRFKFNVWYPPKPEQMYSDVFTIQIWDKDVVGYNDLIGQARINLNKIHRIIEKAVKRKRPTKASMKVIEKGMDIVDKFYFDVYNDKQLDQFGNKVSQGKVQLSFELVPIAQAKGKLENGMGRSEPNLYPTLADPTGRLSFNWLHPLDFIKQLLGPKLYSKVCWYICCLLLVIVFGAFLYVFGGGILANLVVR